MPKRWHRHKHGHGPKRRSGRGNRGGRSPDLIDEVAEALATGEPLALFVNSADAEPRVVEGGRHLLSASDPDDVYSATVEFVKRWR